MLYQDLKRSPWRNPAAEKNWKKDLLETDFISKKVDDSYYYCPLDRVARSLTFLMEIGWKIFDHQGRRVVRQKGKLSANGDAERENPRERQSPV